MNLREAAQQALEALELWGDCLTDPSAQPGWRFSVVGEKAIANLRDALAKDATPRPTDEDNQKQLVAYRLSETDIYDFAGWLTTRPGVLEIGTSKEAGPMAEAVGEYIRTFSERFAAPPAPTWTDAHWTKYERGIVTTERERIAAWVEDMCAGLDAKTIANGIRNNGNDDIGAFEVKK